MKTLYSLIEFDLVQMEEVGDVEVIVCRCLTSMTTYAVEKKGKFSDDYDDEKFTTFTKGLILFPIYKALLVLIWTKLIDCGFYSQRNILIKLNGFRDRLLNLLLEWISIPAQINYLYLNCSFLAIK